ncbi:hypothetical protein DL767_008491 [Monosporascus sp. MG133]|nr:hypothetical protein DL767_008491 [Monosporascus sp. MG133]
MSWPPETLNEENHARTAGRNGVHKEEHQHEKSPLDVHPQLLHRRQSTSTRREVAPFPEYRGRRGAQQPVHSAASSDGSSVLRDPAGFPAAAAAAVEAQTTVLQ